MALLVGVELGCVRELRAALDAAVATGFEFVAAPLFHPRARRERAGAPRDEPPTRSDLTLDSSCWSTSVVGALSPWLALDSGDAAVRLESERALRQELQWASHLGVPAVLAPPPSGAQASASARGPLAAPNYVAHLYRALEAAPALHVWLRVPLAIRAEPRDADEEAEAQRGVDGGGDGGGAGGSGAAPTPLHARARDDPWEGWHALQQLSEGHPRLSVALELTAALPSPAHLARWAGEPVKAAILPTAIFAASAAGGSAAGERGRPEAGGGALPALSPAHEQLVGLLAAYGVQFLLRGRPRVAGGYAPYLHYLRALTERTRLAFSPSFELPGCTPASQYLAAAAAAAASQLQLAAASAPLAAAPAPGDLASDDARGWEAVADPQGRSPQRAFDEAWGALSASYLDVLQAPLQPLADNLESVTYETFERDPVKYDQYQAAIEAALRARRGRGAAGTAQPPVVVVWVVGAGRGPLVERALAAGAATGVPVRVVAVEKNANAVITLRNLRASRADWRERVTIISSDMRHLTQQQQAGGAPSSSAAATAAEGQRRVVFSGPQGVEVEPADVLVSELLGSFGDNELSPECLDGVLRFLRQPPPPPAPLLAPAAAAASSSSGASLAGVSIPSAYTSFLAPVSSHRLWSEARAFGAATREETKWLETAYVVRMWRHHALGPPQAAFTFSHGVAAEAGVGAGEAEEGAPCAPPDNRRYTALRWVMPGHPGAPAHVLHGFGGYFDATLYAPPPAATPGGGDGSGGGGCEPGEVHLSSTPQHASSAPQPEPEVHISTAPHSHTPGMFSWFPLFFPLRSPVHVQPGDVVELHMWRCVSASKVWYEWALASPAVSPVHNPAGRSYAIGL